MGQGTEERRGGGKGRWARGEGKEGGGGRRKVREGRSGLRAREKMGRWSHIMLLRNGMQVKSVSQDH